jgi:hypothetical protein
MTYAEFSEIVKYTDGFRRKQTFCLITLAERVYKIDLAKKYTVLYVYESQCFGRICKSVGLLTKEQYFCINLRQAFSNKIPIRVSFLAVFLPYFKKYTDQFFKRKRI